MKTFTKEELDTIITNHKKWLNDENDGIRANLRDANLQNADLRDANLRCADLQSADLRWADLQSADLRNANLRWADLQSADLRNANLQYANLDFSCLPLWCGGSKFKANKKLIQQILAHICTIEIIDIDEEMKAVIEAILPEAKKSHRASDLGLIKE